MEPKSYKYAIILFLVLFFGVPSGKQAIIEISDRDPEIIKVLASNEYIKHEETVSGMIDKISDAYKIKNKNEYKEAITHASIRYEVPPELIIATIAVESEFKQKPVSVAGAVGAMQIIPKYWKTKVLNPNKLYDNIQLGTHALRTYKNSCGKWACAFKAYNVGITNYNKGNMIESQRVYYARIERAIAAL